MYCSPRYLRPSRRRRCAGYSMLELLVVTVIIGGFLGACACSIYRSTPEDAQAARAGDEIRQVVTAAHAFRSQKDRMPVSLPELMTFTRAAVPEVDPWGRPYSYSADGETVTMWSGGMKPDDPSDDIFWDADHGHVVSPVAK
jgi:prepilin-type N-terminal cleavage/methylation domain-containing protein